MRQIVAAENVKIHADWTQSVCGLKIAIALEVVAQTPAVLVIRGVNHQLPEVMYVRALRMGQRTEDAFFNHLQYPQLFAVVAAILQHDAMLLGLFGGAN